MARLVWKYFGDYKLKKVWIKESYILHKDGDLTNNKIDNLYTSTGYTDKLKKWQVDMYNIYAEKNVKLISKKMYKSLKYYNIEIEEFIQEAMIYIWRYLNEYVENEPFYNFCIHKSKYAYFDLKAKQIIKAKNEITMCNFPKHIQERY